MTSSLTQEFPHPRLNLSRLLSATSRCRDSIRSEPWREADGRKASLPPRAPCARYLARATAADEPGEARGGAAPVVDGHAGEAEGGIPGMNEADVGEQHLESHGTSSTRETPIVALRRGQAVIRSAVGEQVGAAAPWKAGETPGSPIRGHRRSGGTRCLLQERAGGRRRGPQKEDSQQPRFPG